MDKPKITAKDFFLWAGALVSFYWTVIAYTFLVFDYINYTFPNPLAYYPADPYQSGISGEMASVIVLLPVFLLLIHLIRKGSDIDPSRKEIWVRRWAIILTLFLAGAAMAGDLIALLTTFLNGESLTTAFLLKVLVIILVAAGVFMHFFADLKNYWDTNPSRRKLVRIGVAGLAVITIGSGFLIVGTPAEARLARFDAQKINDLQNIQYQVINYWQAKQKLPSVMNDLNNSLNYSPVQVDPQSGEPYVYQATGALTFKLCAMFNAESRGSQNIYYESRAMMPVPAGVKGMMQDNWQHDSGQVCFDRTIDPSFYPPLTKQP
ncbi:sulfite exporter TauE/SafE family protein [Candidatus Kaiserbacteria bacterium]|nr:sulfite exporter TauE/SafE family protein [Candidatus Kaiserbacteria bacterium]